MSIVVKGRLENGGFLSSSELTADQCVSVGRLQTQIKNCQKQVGATVLRAHIGLQTI